MATFFEAVYGDTSGTDNERPINKVFVVVAIIRDYMEGEITAQEGLDFLGLDPIDDATAITQMQTILNRIDNCTPLYNKENYISTLRDIMCMADAKVKYNSESEFNARIDAIVVRTS